MLDFGLWTMEWSLWFIMQIMYIVIEMRFLMSHRMWLYKYPKGWEKPSCWIEKVIRWKICEIISSSIHSLKYLKCCNPILFECLQFRELPKLKRDGWLLALTKERVLPLEQSFWICQQMLNHNLPCLWGWKMSDLAWIERENPQG